MSYTAKVIAVLGRTLRAGRWKLADDSLVIAVFGRCVLDLSRAYVDEDDDDLSMSIFVLFGSVSIVLPPGCDVEPSGIALLASSEVEIPSEKTDDITQDVLAPLDISWFAMFGRVRINELALDAPTPAESSDPPHLGGGMLAPPSTDVFDDGALSTPAPDAPPDTPTNDDEQSAEEAAAEEAALRDEIAQWRTETGRPEPDRRTPDDPAAEIEPDPEPGDGDSASQEEDVDAIDTT